MVEKRAEMESGLENEGAILRPELLLSTNQAGVLVQLRREAAAEIPQWAVVADQHAHPKVVRD